MGFKRHSHTDHSPCDSFEVIRRHHWGGLKKNKHQIIYTFRLTYSFALISYHPSVFPPYGREVMRRHNGSEGKISFRKTRLSPCCACFRVLCRQVRFCRRPAVSQSLILLRVFRHGIGEILQCDLGAMTLVFDATIQGRKKRASELADSCYHAIFVLNNASVWFTSAVFFFFNL